MEDKKQIYEDSCQVHQGLYFDPDLSFLNYFINFENPSQFEVPEDSEVPVDLDEEIGSENGEDIQVESLGVGIVIENEP